MRVVLDTNVLISAFISQTGAPAQIFALWRSGDLEIIVSSETLDELTRVLSYPKVARYLRYTPEQIERFLDLLRMGAELLESENLGDVTVVNDDPDDNKFFALALAAQAQYIISGDKAHVLPVRQYEDIQVIAPATFLQTFHDGT
jgi:putative PIN family toxin of toxin-antitoxin system